MELSDKKPFQAKDLKSELAIIRGNLKEHKLTKPKATKQISLTTDLVRKKSQAQFGLRVILLVASFLFLSALVGKNQLINKG